MKTLTTMTAIAALIAGLSIAGAQTNTGKTADPSSINAAPTGEGNTGKSGMQSPASKDMPSGTAPRATTGASDSSPVNPNEKSATDNGKLKAKDLK